MKIKISLFIIILILAVNHIFGQEEINTIKVTYECLANKITWPKDYDYYVESSLYVNDSVSQYKFEKPKKVIGVDNFRMTIETHNFIDTYKYKVNELTEQRKLESGKVIQATWSPDYQWEITDDSKEINGYKAYKAITKSIEIDSLETMYYGDVYAWFTPDIPLPVGPDRYVGLPGLILEISYERSNIYTKLKSIEFNAEFNYFEYKKPVGLDDPRDVIYFYHHNPKLVNETLKKAE